MIIRPAAFSDVDAVMAVEKTGILHPWTRESIESVIKDDGKICLASYEGDTLTGYIYASYVLDEAEIGNICILPGSRGQGIGKALLDKMLESLKERDIKTVFLEVEADNAPAVRLYEKAGFIRYNERRDYYGPGKDALLYSVQI